MTLIRSTGQKEIIEENEISFTVQSSYTLQQLASSHREHMVNHTTNILRIRTMFERNQEESMGTESVEPKFYRYLKIRLFLDMADSQETRSV